MRGSSSNFSSSSSIRFIFHLRRCNCHVPSAKVKTGMIPTRIIVGVSHGSFRTLYRAGTDGRCERENQNDFEHDEWRQRRNVEERTNIWSHVYLPFGVDAVSSCSQR